MGIPEAFIEPGNARIVEQAYLIGQGFGGYIAQDRDAVARGLAAIPLRMASAPNPADPAGTRRQSCGTFSKAWTRRAMFSWLGSAPT
jgi:hypothetical protein